MGKPETKETKEENVTLSKEEHEKLLKQAKELEELRDKFLRSAADYENAKKRLAKERDEFIKFSQEKLIRDILPILDNFERALAHSDTSNPIVAGVQLTWKQLLDVLKAHGLKRLSVEGGVFDPHRHEAVDQVEEKGPEGVIVQEITAGYLLQERVIRPAKVIIRVAPGSKGKEKVEEKEEEIT
ncbi:MAG: nucleotide exchange factor GrpE [Candidatus Omnitrophica bacterium]|nr:nucleotide exchange factor GrpE [Candidatus Omnitrophota bacterium]